MPDCDPDQSPRQLGLGNSHGCQHHEGHSKKLLILSALYHDHVKQGADRWERPCELCLGLKCLECKNEGWIKEPGKPGLFLTGEGRELFQAYRYLKDHNVLPAKGALMDQSEIFMRAVDYCNRVNGAFQNKPKSLVKPKEDYQAKTLKNLKRSNDAKRR